MLDRQRQVALVLGIMAILLLPMPALIHAGIDGWRSEDANIIVDQATDMDPATPVDYKPEDDSLQGTTESYLYKHATGSTNGTATVAGAGGSACTVTLLKWTGIDEVTGGTSYRVVIVGLGITVADAIDSGLDKYKVQIAFAAAADDIKLSVWAVNFANGNYIQQVTPEVKKDYTAAGWQNITLDVDGLALQYAGTETHSERSYLVLRIVQDGSKTNYMASGAVISLLIRGYSDYGESNLLGYSRHHMATTLNFIMAIVGLVLVGLATPWLDLPQSVKSRLSLKGGKSKPKGRGY
jgi:hypothetical protein